MSKDNKLKENEVEHELKSLQKVYGVVIEFLTQYSFQLIGALIVVVIGWFGAKYVYALLMRLFAKYRLDMTLARFLANVAKVLVLTAMIVIALGKVGISIAPFVAAIGAASLTAGLALQGSVSNYAAGVLLIVSRPFKVGDTLLVTGVYGVVEEIKLSYTMLRNEDEELISVPNKKMIGDILVNSFEERVVESRLFLTYESDPLKAIALIQTTLNTFSDVSQTHPPLVGIAQLAQGAIEIGLRYWVPTKRYFKMQYDVNLAIYQALRHEGIAVSYPKHEIQIVGGTFDPQKV